MKTSLEQNRPGYTFADLVVTLVVLIALAALLAPALAQSRDGAKANVCQNNAKQISIALQNHHDTRKSFPLASTRFISAKPRHAGDADAAGYSWLTMLLPFLEQSEYFDRIVKTSDKFQKDPYDPAVTTEKDEAGIPQRNFKIDDFLCPSFLAGQQDDAPAPQPADKRVAPNSGAGISNYFALSGSHFFNKDGIGRLLPADKLNTQPDGRVVPASAYEGNGALPFPGQNGNRMMKNGLGLQSFSDGTSNVIVFAESIEPEFAAWLDGQEMSLVAAWPGNPDIPEVRPSTQPNAGQTFGWTDAQLPNNWVTIGRPNPKNPADASLVYLAASRWSGGKDRKWGPSSYHGGLVTHAFADAHTKMIKDDIDKNIYLQLVTRNGREVVPPDFR